MPNNPSTEITRIIMPHCCFSMLSNAARIAGGCVGVGVTLGVILAVKVGRVGLGVKVGRGVLVGGLGVFVIVGVAVAGGAPLISNSSRT